MKVDEDVRPPQRATKTSLCYDFFAPRDIVLKPWEWTTVHTGVRFTDDDTVKGRGDWGMLLHVRSGLGIKYGVQLKNTTGVIDSDYREEIIVTMKSEEVCRIKKGRAFIQGQIVPLMKFDDEEPPIMKREGGFGSTDKI